LLNGASATAAIVVVEVVAAVAAALSDVVLDVGAVVTLVDALAAVASCSAGVRMSASNAPIDASVDVAVAEVVFVSPDGRRCDLKRERECHLNACSAR
jgi:hypothetical protein